MISLRTFTYIFVLPFLVTASGNSYAGRCPCSYGSPKLNHLTSEEPMPDYHAACLVPLDKVVDTIRRVSNNFRVSGNFNQTVDAQARVLTTTNFNVASTSDLRTMLATGERETSEGRAEVSRLKAEYEADRANRMLSPLRLEKLKIAQIDLAINQAFSDYASCELRSK